MKTRTFDEQYKDILQDIVTNGILQNNRTGEPSFFIPSAMIKVDLRDGFPVCTLRQCPTKAPVAEMIGFLRGYDNAQDFADLGCKYWFANANEPTAGSTTSDWLSSPWRLGENDLGEIYGVLWRRWPNDDGTYTDQIQHLIERIQTAPNCRRLIVSAWNPQNVIGKRGALAPCHMLFKVILDNTNRVMHLSWSQRSNDTILGTPSNLVEYAFLLELLARICGYTAGTLTGHLDDVHIYKNHFKAATEMLERDPLPLPRLVFDDSVPRYNEAAKFIPATTLETIRPDQVKVVGYQSHPAISDLKMAV